MRHSASHFGLVAFVMIMCIFSMSVLLPFAFSGGVSLPALEVNPEIQHIRQTIITNVSDVQDEQMTLIQHQMTLMQQQMTQMQQQMHETNIRETKASDMQAEKMTQLWQQIHSVWQMQHIHQIKQIHQTHLQQKQHHMHVTETTQAVRKLSQVFIHSYIDIPYVHKFRLSFCPPPPPLSLSLSHTHTP
jgi:type III secretory pathway component EscV